MRQIITSTVIMLTLPSLCYAIGFGFGAYYVYGLPISDLTAHDAQYMGDTMTINTETGIPFKMGHLNFGAGGVLTVWPFLNVEGGFELHGQYKNKEATFKGTVDYHGQQTDLEWDEPADNITWFMMNFYAGNRVKIFSSKEVKFSADAGLVISRSKFEPEEEWLGENLQKGQYIIALNPGVYFGGVINFFVSSKTAITIPVRYNYLFAADYGYYVQAGPAGDYYDVPNYTEKWKPPSLLTVGAGIEYYVF
ncbi:MAG: hypothetical protein JSW52_03280 [Candidatus Coatesbacteria bacterium]|nr:MAG: hypothetical protein JSW52_03280 [Candidatus Coatesbacteria bacterium]